MELVSSTVSIDRCAAFWSNDVIGRWIGSPLLLADMKLYSSDHSFLLPIEQKIQGYRGKYLKKCSGREYMVGGMGELYR